MRYKTYNSSEKPSKRIISLGAGVQSTVMALMADRGDFGEKPDCAIFADTQWEPEGIYTHLNWLESQLSYPVYRVTAGNIRQDTMNGLNSTGQPFTSMPLFVRGGGMGRRQCTNEYKIRPIRKKIRELLGVGFGKHMPKKTIIETWIGISLDESMRMKPSRDKWNIHRWPLIEKRMHRHHCTKWFEENYPGRALIKSACIGCPYHDDRLWGEMKKTDKKSFNDAVEFDLAIRNKGSKLKGIDKQQFLHRSCKPLSEVDFSNAEDNGQIDSFNNECEGMCGV